MSDYIPPWKYRRCPNDKYDCQFRALVMHLFMDDLKMEEVEKIFFLCQMPERLRDEGPSKFRSEVLSYARHQLYDDWIKRPTELQNLLKEVGRKDLCTRVGELVASCPGMCEEPCVEKQEAYSSTASMPQLPPVQETKRFSQTPIEEDKSSTQGALCREAQPVAENGSSPCSRSTDGKAARTEYMEKIPEEIALQEDEKQNLLKRTSSTASEARSSGYFSNPRSSNPRISQLSIPESVTEYEERDNLSLASIRQSNCDEDEGLMMDISHTEDFVSSLEKKGDSNSTETPSPSDEISSSAESAFRPRCYQMSATPNHKKLANKVFTNTTTDLPPENRCRSKSLPSNSRHLHNNALHSIAPLFNSSSTSLDSETTAGSPSEVSSTSGSQLSLASSNSDSRCGSLKGVGGHRQKPYPVVSHVNISGSMTIKVKNVLKSIDKKDHKTPLTSGEFPPQSGYGGPRYEMRFFPSNFSNTHASLYIDVARSYLKKKAKSRQHNIIDVPAMDITVSLSYDSDGAACSGAESRDGLDIKTVTVSTEMKTIDSHSKAMETAVVASFPQLVSHSELKLTEPEGRSVVICVNMKVCSTH